MLADRNRQPLLPIRISSSISPVYNNDPEFSVLHISPQHGDVTDLVTYSLDLSSNPPAWRPGYSFFKAYGIRTLDTETGAALVARIRAGDGTARQEYEAHYGVGAPPSFQPGNFDYYGCALTTLSEPDYKTCVCH